MKQLTTALITYRQDYDEKNVLMWRPGVTNKFGNGPARSWWQGGLYSYLKSTGVFKEPDTSNPFFGGETEPMPGWANGDSSYRFESGIGLNWYIPSGGGTDGGYFGRDGTPDPGLTDSQVGRPAERIVFLETSNAVVGGPNCSIGITYSQWEGNPVDSGDPSKYGYGGYFGFPHHNLQTNLGFYDGHVKSMRMSKVPESYFDLANPNDTEPAGQGCP